MPEVLVCAGELSGDQLAAPVVEALSRRRPDLRWYGWGGPALERAGVELLGRQEGLAVTGVTEVLGRLPRLLQAGLRLLRAARRRPPRLALLVDYPGVNLRLARLLHRRGTRVLYLGAPQRWAWLSSRTAALRQQVDRLVVCLPFEEAWFRARGVPAVYLGHPLRDRFQLPPRDQAGAALDLPPGPPVLGLFPGSRRNEILRHLPPLRATVARLGRAVRPLLGTTPGAGAGLCRELAPELVQASPSLTLAVADVALCASGTITLEAALAGVPCAIFYRLSPLSFAVARRLVRVPYIGLPNLILDEPLLPELIQDQVTPEQLVRVVHRLLEAGPRLRQGLRRVVELLGPPGASERIAELAETLL